MVKEIALYQLIVFFFNLLQVTFSPDKPREPDIFSCLVDERVFTNLPPGCMPVTSRTETRQFPASRTVLKNISKLKIIFLKNSK